MELNDKNHSGGAHLGCLQCSLLLVSQAGRQPSEDCIRACMPMGSPHIIWSQCRCKGRWAHCGQNPDASVLELACSSKPHPGQNLAQGL
eukprot:scaffold6180_cov21-Tisochrysis_lutea.AAC.1